MVKIMKINSKFILLLFIIFFVSMSLVSASDNDNQTLMIDDNTDTVLSVDDSQNFDLSIDESTPDNYTASVGTFTELQDLIWASTAGDTITLDKDYEVDSALSRQHIIIDRSLTINGNGHTLDGKNTKRIFYIEPQSTNTVLKNINFVNGYNKEAGAAIFWRADNGVLTDCTFTNNIANQNGGAVYWSADKGTATNNIFKNNKAGVEKLSSYQSGGAIYWEGNDGKASNNQFLDNYALTNGGAITWKGSNGNLNNNLFTNNFGKESGGAVYWDGPSGLIDSNNFTSNTGELSGGALYYEADNGVASNNKFMKNIAKTNGGAIRWKGNSGTVTDNYFESNSASLTGGAIYWEGTKGQLNKNQFIKNKADVSAGAIMWNGNSGALADNIYTDNTAKEYGGAIYFKGNYSSLTNSQFENNKASKSGGALYWQGETGELIGNTFTKNTAGTSGGAIRWEANKATLTSNTFEGNTASNTGYAIYGEGDNAQITKNSFINYEEGQQTLDWRGNNNKISDNTYGNSRETKLTMNEPTIYYGGSGKLTITLTDKTSKALAKKDIQLTFEGTATTLSTDANGKAEYTIKDLTLGTYKATANFAGDKDYDASQASATVIIKSTIEAKDLTTEVGNVNYNATFLDSNGKALAKGEYVSFTVENDVYRTQVGDNGVATATINKGVGDYTIISTNTKTGETASNKLKITKANPNLKVNAPDITEGEVATFDISAKIQEGLVILTINTADYNATLEKGKAKITVSSLTGGKYPYSVKYNGDANYSAQSVTGTLNVKSDSIIIDAPDITKYFHGSERLTVKLTDKTGAPLKDKTVTIKINGIEYTRTTAENGITSIALGLDSGNYTAEILFKGDADYKAANTTCNVLIKSTVFGKDIAKIEKSSEPYRATFLDSTGKTLAKGTEIEFNINGIFYKRIIGDNGEGKLNLNLESGKYIITATNTVTGEYASNTIIIKPRIVNNSDVTKLYRNGTQYYVTVLDDNGKPVKAGNNVTFNINGVFYTRQTNENGTAKLNLNLQPGDYIITAEYKKCRASNKIKILPVLSAEDIKMKYKDGTKFIVNLVDGQGNPYPNQNVTFNINGVFYNRVTDKNGDAKLNINLMPGTYIITSSYDGSNIANKVTITS